MNIERVITELGLLEKITSGDLLCSECGEPVSIDNIECLYKQNDEIKVCCEKIKCCRAVLGRKITTGGILGMACAPHFNDNQTFGVFFPG